MPLKNVKTSALIRYHKHAMKCFHSTRGKLAQQYLADARRYENELMKRQHEETARKLFRTLLKQEARGTLRILRNLLNAGI